MGSAPKTRPKFLDVLAAAFSPAARAEARRRREEEKQKRAAANFNSYKKMLFGPDMKGREKAMKFLDGFGDPRKVRLFINMLLVDDDALREWAVAQIGKNRELFDDGFHPDFERMGGMMLAHSIPESSEDPFSRRLLSLIDAMYAAGRPLEAIPYLCSLMQRPKIEWNEPVVYRVLDILGECMAAGGSEQRAAGHLLKYMLKVPRFTPYREDIRDKLGVTIA